METEDKPTVLRRVWAWRGRETLVGMSALDPSDRHVLVIGGSGAIGSAVVGQLIAVGATVTATATSSSRFGDDAARWIELDVTDHGAVDAALDGADITDIVSAGAARPFGSLAAMSGDDLSALVDTKLWGSFHIGRSAGHHLPADGTLTFVSGLLAAYPDAASPVAAVSAAVETLARGLAVELAPIRVNAVSPDALGSSGRGTHDGTADDVAQAIISCITNRWMSGAVVELHGAGKP